MRLAFAALLAFVASVGLALSNVGGVLSSSAARRKGRACGPISTNVRRLSDVWRRWLANSSDSIRCLPGIGR